MHSLVAAPWLQASHRDPSSLPPWSVTDHKRPSWELKPEPQPVTLISQWSTFHTVQKTPTQWEPLMPSLLAQVGRSRSGACNPSMLQVPSPRKLALEEGCPTWKTRSCARGSHSLTPSTPAGKKKKMKTAADFYLQKSMLWLVGGFGLFQLYLRVERTWVRGYTLFPGQFLCTLLLSEH